jgi:hypothetical protein
MNEKEAFETVIKTMQKDLDIYETRYNNGDLSWYVLSMVGNLRVVIGTLTEKMKEM